MDKTATRQAAPTRAPSPVAAGFSFGGAVLLALAGAFHLVVGVVAVFKDEFFVVTDKWLFSFDVTVWGWIHILLAALLIGTAILIVKGDMVGRVLGIIFAGLSALGAFMWLPYYPVWSIMIVALDVAVIWALSVHGRDITAIK